MLQTALDGACRLEHSPHRTHRTQTSHARALAARDMAAEIVPVHGLGHDTYARSLSAERLARMPINDPGASPDEPGLQPEAPWPVSPKADSAALLLLATPRPAPPGAARARSTGAARPASGSAPGIAMLCAVDAARATQARSGWRLDGLHALELHDAFAARAWPSATRWACRTRPSTRWRRPGAQPHRRLGRHRPGARAGRAVATDAGTGAAPGRCVAW